MPIVRPVGLSQEVSVLKGVLAEEHTGTPASAALWRLELCFLAWNRGLSISFMCSVHIYCADAWPGIWGEGGGRHTHKGADKPPPRPLPVLQEPIEAAGLVKYMEVLWEVEWLEQARGRGLSEKPVRWFRGR